MGQRASDCLKENSSEIGFVVKILHCGNKTKRPWQLNRNFP